MADGDGKGHCHCWYWYSLPVKWRRHLASWPVSGWLPSRFLRIFAVSPLTSSSVGNLPYDIPGASSPIRIVGVRGNASRQCSRPRKRNATYAYIPPTEPSAGPDLCVPFVRPPTRGRRRPGRTCSRCGAHALAGARNRESVQGVPQSRPANRSADLTTAGC